MIKKLITALLCMTAPASGLSLEYKTEYLFDFLVTSNWDQAVSLEHPVRDDLTVGGRLHYLDITQDSISGITQLHAAGPSATVKASWRHFRRGLVVDAEAGADCLWPGVYRPRVLAALTKGFSVPPNPVLKNLRFKHEWWYSYRHLNAAAVRNRIGSYGINVEATGGLGENNGFGVNYRLEFLAPDESPLDTAFINRDDKTFMIPDSLDRNTLTAFYAYVYRTVSPGLVLAYAFSWADSKIDRWVLTRKRLVQEWGGFPPRMYEVNEYAYYPYPTPVNTLAHLLGATARLPWGKSARWEAKAAVPVYSSRSVLYGPAQVTPGTPDTRAYYTEKHTGPLTFETKAVIAIKAKTGLTLSYEYFCLPYRSWAYFTRDSYSYHKAGCTVKYDF